MASNIFWTPGKMPRTPRTPDLTGDRLEQYESLKAARRYITKALYAELLAEIVRSEAQAKKQEALAKARAARAASLAYIKAYREELKQKLAAAAAKREARKKAKALDSYVDKDARVFIFNTNSKVDADGYAISLFIRKALLGRQILFTATHKFPNGKLVRIREKVINFADKTRITHIHQEIRKFLIWEGSAGALAIFKVYPSDADFGDDLPAGTQTLISLSPFVKVPPQKLVQAFANDDDVVYPEDETVSNPAPCIINPIAEIYEKMAANSKSVASRKECERKARQIRKFGEQYPNGVPEGEPMEALANLAKRKIIIKDVIGGDFQVYNEKSNRPIIFTNTRENHVEVGNLCIQSKAETLPKHKLASLLEETLGKNQFATFHNTYDEPRMISTLNGNWKEANPLHDIYKRHNEANRINDYGVDAVKYPQLNAYLKEAALVNSSPVKLADVPVCYETKCADLKSAYTQFKFTEYFRGFIGHINQWRRLPAMSDPRAFMEKHLGIYKFRVVSNPVELLVKLGLTGTHILPGPEVCRYVDLGVKVELLSAAFGKRCDINFSDEMMAKPQKAYQTWAGCMSYDRPDYEINFPASWGWARHLSATLGEDRVFYNQLTGCVRVRIAKKVNMTRHHILAFLTSYCRINIVDAILKLSETATVSEVMLDGIYYQGTSTLGPAFDEKPAIVHEFYTDGWFQQNDVDDAWMPMLADELLLNDCVLAGAGGSGKTTSILTDSGFAAPLYIVPTHRLGRKMYEEHGTRYLTINKLIGIDCPAFKLDNPTPPVLLIDETTMLDASWCDKVLEMYPTSLCLFAGDIMWKDGKFMWFQCRNGKPGEFRKLWQGVGVGWKYFTTDYRSLDDELKTLKATVRSKMIEMFLAGADGDVGDAKELAEWVEDSGLTIHEMTDAAKMFDNSQDTWIAGTHNTNEILLKLGVVSGYMNKQTREVSRDAECGWEKRGSFTTHGFQGQTISTGRVFVSIHDSFELAMFYTAISRVRRMAQLVLVA
jgi:hypothetical protein